jgi:NAD(P) transhydrogenase subunit alpha
MKPGSVIIDLAASTGGNCELSKDNQTVVHNGVKIIGNSQLPTDMPTDASRMYGKNMINFLKLIITKEGAMNLNWDDDIVKGTAVTHGKEIVHERVKSVINS